MGNYILSNCSWHFHIQENNCSFCTWVYGFLLLNYQQRFDSDVSINLMLSMNFVLYDINSVVLLPPLSIFTTFFVRMEKVWYFSLFSAIQSTWPWNSFASSLMTKWKSNIEPLWKTASISLDTSMCRTSIFFSIVTMVFNFSIVFIIKTFFYEIFSIKITYFCIFACF